jgi:uncharacterized phiE125 gp8 family phage protein
MDIKYKVKTAPTIHPVTLAQLKANLHILSTDVDASRDAYLQDLLYAAEDWAQARIGRQICRATYTAYLSEFPSGGDLVIHFGPVDSITSVKYYASGATTTTTLSASLYQLDNVDLSAVLRFIEMPSLNTDRLNAIEIELLNGWTTADVVPRKIKDAIILYASERYLNPENRQLNFGTSIRVTQAENLLTEFRPQRY